MLKETETVKYLGAPGFNSIFHKGTGFTATFGTLPSDDPEMSPLGPLIADIEVSTICDGHLLRYNTDGTLRGQCIACYKNNGPVGHNMSLDTFKQVFNSLPKFENSLTCPGYTGLRTAVHQAAFGVGRLDANPELPDIMHYCRDNGVIPNITINGRDLTDSQIEMLKVCGAISVSLYDYDDCYTSVKRLKDAGHKQVNIHCLLSLETRDQCFKVLEDYLTNDLIKDVNAIVFMSLKQRGRGINLNKIDYTSYKELITHALSNKIPIGFDSCGAHSFASIAKDLPAYDNIKDNIESCESSQFSIYADVNGKFFPCSFSNWDNGLEAGNDFMTNVWYHPRMIEFRNNLLSTTCAKTDCRKCPIFDVDIEPKEDQWNINQISTFLTLTEL